MKRINVWLRTFLLLALTAILMGGGLILLNRSENAKYKETRGTMTEGFGQLKTVTVNGVTYREKPAVMTMLLAGIDKEIPEEKEEEPEDTSGINYRGGGQADFLLLLAIDHTDQKIHQLQIDRDTMAEIDILGIYGNEVGTRVEQICLAHRYGSTPKENARYTIQAVERLLDGVKIDGYYMVDYSAMGLLNDTLGGVTVNIDFDMSSIDPSWTPGHRITLHGDEAEEFVRARMTVGAGTNEERMVRQNEFMENAITLLKKRIKENLSFGENLFRQMEEKSVTNMTIRWLAEELSESYDYETLSVEHPAGEYSMGSDGYIEFHMEPGAATSWVLEHLYTVVEDTADS